MMTLADGLAAFARDAGKRLDTVPLGPTQATVGRVESVADGVARVSGLPDARLGERLQMADGSAAYVLSLEPDWLACVLLDATSTPAAGDRVSATGRVLEVPVGEALLGCIVDPLGRPLDAGKPLQTAETRPIERDAPAIHERDLVTEPVETGILVIDALFALGRGQRELIIGDPATGKTALAIDTLIHQRDSELICIYVAIGQTLASTARVVEALRRFGRFERCIVIVASAASAPGLQWMAPFAGMTVGEYFRDRGQHAVVVLDDLSKHAVAHRELALLTHQPPGREAYPGDIFYVHARLLERAAQLSSELGGGSLTALPVAETQAGNLAAYIPTNLISITDGQFVLDRKLFDANHKPAINTGLSVSRIGGKTQHASMRQAVGSLRLDYAQFLELEQFTRFGTAVEARVAARLARGRAIRALLDQPQYAPQSQLLQLAQLHLLASGALDGLSQDRIVALRAALADWIAEDGQTVAALLARGEALDETALAALREALSGFAQRQAAAR